VSTPEQVEAVARKLDGTYTGRDIHYWTHVATTAIAAYEETSPVVSDEELCDLYETTYWESATPVNHDEARLVAIRVVRARLEGLTTT
jgi:hypothetical protein